MAKTENYVLCCDEDGDHDIHIHGPEGRISLPYAAVEDISLGPNGPMLPVATIIKEKPSGVLIRLDLLDSSHSRTPILVHADHLYSKEILEQLASDRC